MILIDESVGFVDFSILEEELKLSQEEFEKRVHAHFPNIQILSPYINAHSRVKCHCADCGHEWAPFAGNLSGGHGCPECKHRNARELFSMGQNEFVRRVALLNPNIQILGTYVNNTTKIHVKCLIDGYEWDPFPSALLKGHGCPRCAKQERYTTSEFKKKLRRISPHIEVIGEYINNKTPIQCRCAEDGNVWWANPSRLLQGCGCPVCNKSHGESLIGVWLKQHNIVHIFQKYFDDCKDINTLPFDYYCPELKCAIEFDGIQHFEPVRFGGVTFDEAQRKFEITKRHDTIKNNYCLQHFIKLIRIPYTEIDQIDTYLSELLV